MRQSYHLLGGKKSRTDCICNIPECFFFQGSVIFFCWTTRKSATSLHGKIKWILKVSILKLCQYKDLEVWIKSNSKTMTFLSVWRMMKQIEKKPFQTERFNLNSFLHFEMNKHIYNTLRVDQYIFYAFFSLFPDLTGLKCHSNNFKSCGDDRLISATFCSYFVVSGTWLKKSFVLEFLVSRIFSF